MLPACFHSWRWEECWLLCKCNKMRQNWPQNQSLWCFQLSASCQKSEPEVWRTAARKTTKVKINSLTITIYNRRLIDHSSQRGPHESVRWDIKVVYYFTNTHTEVHFTAVRQNKHGRSLTIWERLLGQPLISSIFSLAEERWKEEAETER